MAAADSNNNSTHNCTVELDPGDGQQYILELRDKLLDLLSPAQSIQEVGDRLIKLYPQSKLVKDAIKKADESKNDTNKSNRNLLHNITSFAIAIVGNLIRDGVVGNRSENELSKYKIAIIQYIIDDVLNLAGEFVKCQKAFLITRKDIRTAMHADEDLMDMFLSDDKRLPITDKQSLLALINNPDRTNNHNAPKQLTTYKQKVRNMVDPGEPFVRGYLIINLIIKVFKKQLEQLPQIREEVKTIFCNIEDLYDLSFLLLTALEDSLKMVGQDDEVPYVGSEILDLAQAEEFHAYFTFAYKRRSKAWRDAYRRIISSKTTMTAIRVVGQSEQPFDLAVKHLLPIYLSYPIAQFEEYFEDISDLYHLSKKHDNRHDELTLKETLSILIKTRNAISEELFKTNLDQEEIEPLEDKQAESILKDLEKKLDAELQHERNEPLPMPPPDIYKFSEPDSDDNIQIDETDPQNRVIRYATLIKLVERLTCHESLPDIVDTFLITYRSFISDPEELLDLLIERFRIPDPPLSVVFPGFLGVIDDLPERERTTYKREIKRFRQEYSKPVKMRVINVIKSWIKNHYYDFERHPKLQIKLNDFLDEVHDSDKVFKLLIEFIQKSIKQKSNGQGDKKETMLSSNPPPILWWYAKANEPEKFDILTLHPREFARQLTLIESDLFRAIKPSEFINVRDNGICSRRESESPNLSRITRHFTLFSSWIIKCIVEAEDFDKRSAIYNRAIEIMGVLKELNNFTGLLSIGSAMKSAPIDRLSHTKKTMTDTTMKIMDNYNDLSRDLNLKGIQRSLKSCNPPCIPYLGSYQTKLIHAKEGNKTFIDEVDTTTTSPTLSHDEILSSSFSSFSFSNSPATPISPRSRLTMRANCQQTQQPPPSATSTIQNQFNFKSSSVSATPKINFHKQRIRAELVAEICRYQNPPYCLEVQPEIRRYIESIESSMIKFAQSLDAHQTGVAEDNYSAMAHRIDNYLFKQSETIEPKNCTKPPRSKSKLPEYWKSPGIKTH